MCVRASPNVFCFMFISCIFFVSLHTLNFLNGQIVECPVHRVSVDHIRLTLACVQLLKMFTIKLILIRVPLWTQEMFHSPFGASRHMNNEMRVPSFVYASVCMCVCVSTVRAIQFFQATIWVSGCLRSKNQIKNWCIYSSCNLLPYAEKESRSKGMRFG